MMESLQIGLHPDEKGFHLDIVHTCQVPPLWELLEPMFAESVKHAQGMLTMAQLEHMLCRGEATAVVLLEENQIRAAFAVYIAEYPEYKACQIIAAAGRNMKEAADRMDVVGAWAVAQGATKFEAFCRPGMVRLARKISGGRFRPELTLMRCDLMRTLQ